MKRFLHIAGSILGPATTIVPVVTDAVPAGAARNSLVIVGAAITLLSSVFRALGK